jgi:purine-binding chemotaxis protein CheW
MSIHVRLRVAGEAYALPIENVLEVAPLGEVTAVPGAPAGLLGVLNLRGRILAVGDLAEILGLRRTAPGTRMLVVESGDLQASLVIDEVSEVGDLAEPTEATESALLTGATLTGRDLIGFLDLDRVLSTLAQAQP